MTQVDSPVTTIRLVTSRSYYNDTFETENGKMAAKHYAIKQCYSLLVRVKATVESLLSSDSCNVWSTYGGFKRLSDNIQDIFQHQLQVKQSSKLLITLNNNNSCGLK